MEDNVKKAYGREENLELIEGKAGAMLGNKGMAMHWYRNGGGGALGVEGPPPPPPPPPPFPMLLQI